MLSTTTIIIICSCLVLITGYILYKIYKRRKEHYYALIALKKLDDVSDDVHDISDEQLNELKDAIYLVKTKEDPTGVKENLVMGGGPVNTHYWPYYYYSYPYNVYGGAAWPPGLYSKLYNWYPGFNTSGWSFYVRPGIDTKRWPRSRWVRNQGNYYYLNNDQGVKQSKSNSYYF